MDDRDIDAGFWIRPQDHTPEELTPVDTERPERNEHGYQTGVMLSEILIFSAGFWYTAGLKKRIGPVDSVRRWRKL